MINYPILVHNFMVKHKQLINRYPTLVEPAVAKFRLDLIQEELNELEEAMRAGDIYLIADALADLKYVVFGTDITYGIPADTIFESVHDSNMSKDVKDRDGLKVQKGPNYRPPKIAIHIDAAIRLGKQP